MSEQIVTVVENVSQVIEIDLGSVGPRGPAGDPTTVADGAIPRAKVTGLVAILASLTAEVAALAARLDALDSTADLSPDPAHPGLYLIGPDSTLIPDQTHPGLYLLDSTTDLSPDPAHPGLYLMGA